MVGAAGLGNFSGTAIGTKLKMAKPEAVIVVSVAIAAGVCLLVALTFSILFAVIGMYISAVANALSSNPAFGIRFDPPASLPNVTAVASIPSALIPVVHSTGSLLLNCSTPFTNRIRRRPKPSAASAVDAGSYTYIPVSSIRNTRRPCESYTCSLSAYGSSAPPPTFRNPVLMTLASSPSVLTIWLVMLFAAMSAAPICDGTALTSNPVFDQPASGGQCLTQRWDG